jgi:hypothetical protein
MAEELIYFCTTEGFTEAASLPKWPESPPTAVTWHALGDLPGIPDGAFRATVYYALKCIPEVCGLTLEYTPNSKTANILMRAAPLGTPSFGRPGGVLADSELPINLRDNDAQMQQRYDSERWSSEDFAPSGKISLPTVVRHEVCHALGLPHGGKDLMAPTLNSRIAFPGDWTISELVKRYGKPATQPAPKPDEPKDTSTVVIRLPNGIVIQSPKPVTIDNARITYLDR